MDTKIILFIVAILCVLFVGYEIFIHTIKNKQVKGNTYNLTIDLDTLITALKGKENIVDVSATTNKVRFELKDTSVDVEAIKQLGASGIVESNQSVTVIFGKQSPEICKAIKNK